MLGNSCNKLSSCILMVAIFGLAAVLGSNNTRTKQEMATRKRIQTSSSTISGISNRRTEQKMAAQEMAARKRMQTNSLKEGKAIVVSVHVTHHAGTFVCSFMKHFVDAPDFACMLSDKDDTRLNITSKKSWGHTETSKNVEKTHPFFQFISWEYQSFGNLHTTNWEYENLVSFIVMRDPIERFLAGGKCNSFHQSIKQDPTKSTQGLYWEYANAPCADNFALTVLADRGGCGNGYDTSVQCLQSAKDLLSRFTYIIDQRCLDDSLLELGKELGFNETTAVQKIVAQKKKNKTTTRQRIGNNTLFEYLQQKFRRDIELYEWSQKNSILRCPE